MIRALHCGISKLQSDNRGATLVEFAMIAPVLLMVIMALFDLSYNMYVAAMMRGAIQQAARNATIETAVGNTASLDDSVTRAIHAIAPSALVQFSRKNYSNFSDAARPEDYNDVDGDGRCNNGEPFEDVNGNNTWDQDRGKSGNGGARDAVLYTVDVTYKRGFPIAAFLGFSPTVSAQNQTILRNQPYSAGNQSAPKIGNCP